MTKALYILDHPDEYERCRSHAAERGFGPQDFSIFCPQISTHRIPAFFKDNSMELPLFTAQERLRIDDAAEKMAALWHDTPEARRLADHRGFNRAQWLEHGMDYFFVWVIRQWASSKKIMSDFAPSIIFIARNIRFTGTFSAPRESYYGLFFEKLGREGGVPVEILSHKAVAPKETPSFIPPGRRAGVLGGILNVGARALAALNPGPRVFALSSLAVIEPMLKTRPSGSRWAVVTLNPSPKNFLKLFLKKIPLFSVELKNSAPLMDMSGWEQVEASLLENRELRFDGLNVAQTVMPRFKHIFSVELPALSVWCDAFSNFFSKHAVCLIVVDEDVTVLHRCFVQTAARHSIPSCVIQHGITGQRRGFAPGEADAIAAWGEISKTQLISWGVPAERIHITGSTRLFNQDTAKRLSRRRRTLARLGLPDEKKMVLFTPCRLRVAEHGFLRIKMSRNQNAAFLRSVVLAMQSYPEASLVIKLHPGENAEYAQSLLNESPRLELSRVKMVLNDSIEDLLLAADAVVSLSSTVSIEAMAQDVPIVDLNLFEMAAFIPFAGTSAVAPAGSQEQLVEAIGEALNQPGLRREQRKLFIKTYCAPSNISSVERVSALLETLRISPTPSMNQKENKVCVSC